MGVELTYLLLLEKLVETVESEQARGYEMAQLVRLENCTARLLSGLRKGK